MPCEAGPRVPYPTALLGLMLPDLTFSVPTLGVDFCCSFETPPIPGFPLVLPLGAIFAILAAASLLDPVVAIIDSIVDLLNSILDLIPPIECPFD